MLLDPHAPCIKSCHVLPIPFYHFLYLFSSVALCPDANHNRVWLEWSVKPSLSIPQAQAQYLATFLMQQTRSGLHFYSILQTTQPTWVSLHFVRVCPFYAKVNPARWSLDYVYCCHLKHFIFLTSLILSQLPSYTSAFPRFLSSGSPHTFILTPT